MPKIASDKFDAPRGLLPRWLFGQGRSVEGRVYAEVSIKPHPDCCGLHQLYGFMSRLDTHRDGEDQWMHGGIYRAVHHRTKEQVFASLADKLFRKFEPNLNYHAVSVARDHTPRYEGGLRWDEFLRWVLAHRKGNWRIAKLGRTYRNPNTGNMLQQWRLSRYDPDQGLM